MRLAPVLNISLIAVIGIGVGYLLSHLSASPCSLPVQYQVGAVDSRFNLPTAQFQADLEQAASLWNQAAGRQVLRLVSQNGMPVSMVYDQRQALRSQVDALSQQLGSGQGSLQQQEAQYQQLVASFQSRLQSYNQEVDYWNSHGGASAEEIAKLQAESQELHQLTSQINGMAARLKQNVSLYNQQVEQYNQAGSRYQGVASAEPEEGLYFGPEEKIEVYYYSSHDELVHTLAHELGHSLGLEHVSDKNAIMYSVTNNQTSLTAADQAALTALCQRSDLPIILRRAVRGLMSSAYGLRITAPALPPSH